MYNSIHFSKFMELCNCHYVLENFHQPQKTFHIHLHSVPTLQIFFFFKYSAFHLRTLGVRWRRDLREVSTESGSVSLPSFIPSIHHTLFIEHLVYVRECVKHFINHHHNYTRKVLCLSLMYKWGNEYSGSINYLTRTSQPVNTVTTIWTLEDLTQGQIN